MFRQTRSRFRSRAARVMRLRISRRCTPSEGSALQRTDSKSTFRQTKFRFRSRVARVMRLRISRRCTPSEGFALQRTDSNTKFDRQNLVSVRVQPVLCACAYHGGARPQRDSPYSERTAIYIQIDKISFPFACSPCYALAHITEVHALRHSKKGPLCDPFLLWRRRRDSNPRGLSPKRFSRPPRYDRFDTPPRAKIITRCAAICKSED